MSKKKERSLKSIVLVNIVIHHTIYELFLLTKCIYTRSLVNTLKIIFTSHVKDAFVFFGKLY